MKSALFFLLTFLYQYSISQSLQAKYVKGYIVMEYRVESHTVVFNPEKPERYYTPDICFLCGQYFISNQNLKDTIPFHTTRAYARKAQNLLIQKGDSTAKTLTIEDNHIPDNDTNYFKHISFDIKNSYSPWPKQIKSHQIYTSKNPQLVYYIVFSIKGEVWDCNNIPLLDDDEKVYNLNQTYLSLYRKPNCSKYLPQKQVYCPKSKMKISPLSKKQQNKLHLTKSPQTAIKLIIEY